MRVAVLSDIHANLPALEAVVADAQEHGATHLVCLGDIVGYGPQPIEVLRRLREISNATVLGNHDAAVCGLLNPGNFNPFARETAERAALALSEEDKAWLRELPYIIESKDLAVAHGGFCEPEKFHYLDSKDDAALCLKAMPGHTLLMVGHTHIPCLFVQEESGLVRKLPPHDLSLRQGCRYVVNPGSVGFPRGDKLTADYVLYDTMTRRLLFRSLVYDLAPYRLALVRNGYNPMNYWFLSPSARRRQAEQAFLNPTNISATAIAADSPFRVHRKNASYTRLLMLLAALFVGLILGALYIILPGPFKVAPAPETLRPPEMVSAPSWDELPPFSQWKTDDATPSLQDEKKLRCLATTRHLVSPQIPLRGPLPEALTLSFEVSGTLPEKVLNAETGRSQRPVVLTSQVHFILADGSEVLDEKKRYRTLKQKRYTIQVPREATALRLHYTFHLPAPFIFTLPTLKEKE